MHILLVDNELAGLKTNGGKMERAARNKEESFRWADIGWKKLYSDGWTSFKSYNFLEKNYVNLKQTLVIV